MFRSPFSFMNGRNRRPGQRTWEAEGVLSTHPEASAGTGRLRMAKDDAALPPRFPSHLGLPGLDG